MLRDQEALSKIDIEGAHRSMGDLANVDSMRARISYWQVGLRMFMDHPWTGVGLGNYKQAFLQYQFLGAGDVETTHNDFLQYFCETGLIGGPLFLGFWVYFGVWGALRIRREEDTAARRWMLGLYCGAIAFAMHSLVDFNFQNPSIAAPAFLVAGLFYARCAQTEAAAPLTIVSSPARVRVLAVAFTALTIVLTASVARLYFFELGLTPGELGWRLYYVGDRKALSHQREVAAKFLTELTKVDPDRKSPPYLTVRAARLVIPDLAELETIGTFGTRTAEDPAAMRRLSPGEPVTDDTFVFITSPRRAVDLTTRNSELIIDELEGLDALYPHDPELANELFAWYELLFSYALDATSKKQFAVEAERWARENTERSPQVAWWWLNYARALWLRGSIEPGRPGLSYYFTGLDYYKHAHELFPASGTVAYFYAQALKQLGDELVRKGRVDDGQRLVTESEAMFKRASLLANYRQLIR
jgi:tetratricopeptide (TPR) repeat protein